MYAMNSRTIVSPLEVLLLFNLVKIPQGRFVVSCHVGMFADRNRGLEEKGEGKTTEETRFAHVCQIAGKREQHLAK